MNKFIRAMLITFAACLVIGGGVVIAGIALGGTLDDASVTLGDRDYNFVSHGLFKFDDEEDDDEQVKTKDETETKNEVAGVKKLSVNASEILELDVSLKNCEMKIQTAPDDQISVTVGDGEEGYFSMSRDGDTLKLIDKRKNKNNLKTAHVVLQIPEDVALREVDLELGAGDIEIECLEAEEISMDGGAGALTAKRLIATQQFEAELGVGDFSIQEAQFGQADIDCGVGRLEIKSCQLNGNAKISGGVGDVEIGLVGQKNDFNYELSCGVGELDVFGDSYHSLGKDKEIDNDAPYTLSLECGMGRIEVYQAN